VINYLQHTKKLHLTLQADESGILKWWVDGVFAVHPDMQSHTGVILSMDVGSIYSTSTKQKSNTKISTEVDIVGVNDILPKNLWTRYFLEDQGYGVQDSTVY